MTSGRIVYFSPFENATNTYVDLQKSIWSDLGYEVKPMRDMVRSAKALSSLLDPSNVLCLHWPELQAFLIRGGRPRMSLRGHLRIVAFMLLALLCRPKVVYHVHDQQVHNA